MNRGFLATLFAAAFSFAGLQSAYSAAPVITDLPDYIRVGDAELADRPGGSDANYFVFTNAFQFSEAANDPDSDEITELSWSFAEFSGLGSSPNNRYTVNGVGPVAAGNAAVDALELAGGPVNPGANKINSGAAAGSTGDYASIRDIFFSPGTGSGPFPAPSTLGPTALADGADGKMVRFYVSDGENLDSKDVLVRTVDEAFDEASSEEPGGEVIYSEPNGFLGWEKNGIEDGPDTVPAGPASEDSVDVSTTTDELRVTNRTATSRQRVHGFRNHNVGVYPGADKYVRGKFYLYVTNAANAAVNTVPGFRVRIDNVNAVFGTLSVIPAQTGNTGPTAPNAQPNPNNGNQPYNFYNDISNSAALETRQTAALRPSGDPSKPSLYRVDFDPVDVAAAAGSKLFATFQSYSTANPVNGDIRMTEATILTYPALTDAAGSQIFTYDRRNGTTSVQDVNAGFGRFIADNDLRNGYRQYIMLGMPFDNNPAGDQPTFVNDANGLTFDTASSPVDKFSQALINLEKGEHNVPAANAHWADQNRVQPNKLYRARFYATSNVAAWSNNTNAERQGNIRFRFQVGAWNSYLEFPSPLNANNYDAGVLAADPFAQVSGDIMRQALPSATAANPDNLVAGQDLRPAGHNGGWYTVVSGSPLDDDLRHDVGGTTANRFGAFFNEPGPGAAAESLKSITLGADGMRMARNFVVGNGTASSTVLFFSANRAQLRLHRVELYEYDQIDDGGYAY